jgi:hypothetical protein
MCEQSLEFKESPRFTIQLGELTGSYNVDSSFLGMGVALRIICMKTYRFVSHCKEEWHVKTFL